MNVFVTHRCAVCKKGEAKYRCPRCLIRSCSLPCVKRHKEDVNCNGVREKTNFVKISGFEDLNLLSGKLAGRFTPFCNDSR